MSYYSVRFAFIRSLKYFIIHEYVLQLFELLEYLHMYVCLSFVFCLSHFCNGFSTIRIKQANTPIVVAV